ncbi:cytochrome P450 [Aspergillus homomorphus CBS 101889]|uniref:Cytochrome P450 n=1 Tax=Aspergillus homomorphus (strain CBS 101889) TaxID=1450537 RepID=A0A395I7X4_ASPHC|nr:cytochrome P450 [Aspergillus homomorphus CBS 101889]RAL15168.1 cytochrome P450 [Aspergillus homomorphus CBS 101889]
MAASINSPWTILAIGVLLFVSKCLYRIYFHPLRHIPGPTLAAVTHLEEFYYDVIRGGKFIWRIQEMHKQYGPIVRINPREVHITDPSFYDEIYAGAGRKRNKDCHMTPIFASPSATIATIDHDLHRTRRNQLNGFFSKKAVTELMPVIQSKVVHLQTILHKAYASDQAVNLHEIFASLSADIITHYAYGSDCGFLDNPSESNLILKGAHEIIQACHVHRFFPQVLTVLQVVPPWILRRVRPNLSGIFDMQDRITQQSNDSLRQVAKHEALASDYRPRRTIFDAINDPALPPQERTLQRLREEAFTVLGAATETTEGALTIAMFHLLYHKPYFLRLREELRAVMPDSTDTAIWQDLERLPFLTGVVNESLRLSGISIRLPRVAPQETLHYHEHVIPAGTPMSTISYFIHTNSTIFPEPEKFDPDRWIRAAAPATQGSGASPQKLTKFLVPFTRGSRILAYAELYMTLAAVVRRFDLELYGTTVEDVRFERDLSLPHTDRGARRVRVRVVGLARNIAE